MIIELEKIQKGFEDVKEAFMSKIKSSEDSTSEKIQKMGEEWDAKIAEQTKKLQERKMSLPGLADEKELKSYRIHKLIEAQLNGKWAKDAGFEQKITEELEVQSKSNNAQTGESGGFLVPDEVTSEIIELAMAQTPVMDMGPTVLTGLRGELPIPKVTGRPQMYWVGEEEEATESETKFGEIVLRPKTAAAFTKLSRRLLMQSSGTAEKVTRQELIKAFALGLDTAFLTGGGTDKVPKGITSFDGLTATDEIESPNGNRFTIDKAAEMAMNIDVVNMLRGNLGYIMRPEVLSFMLRERVTQYSTQPEAEGQPITDSVLMSREQLESILGYKIRTTTLLTTSTKGSSTSASTVMFGDWSQFVIGMWEGFEIRASDTAGNASGSALTQRQVWITAFQGIDTNIKDETGLTLISDALTAKSEFS